MEKLTYAGKKVSVGIDVHLSTYHVSCICEGKLVKRASIEAGPEVLVSFLFNYFPDAELETAYEAGFSGFELHRTLAQRGVKSLVINASSIEVASRDRVKTDKRDSKKLAEQLNRGQLKSIRIPSREEEARRVLHRTREQIVRKRAMIMTQIRMRLLQFGVRSTKPKERLTFTRVQAALDSKELAPEVTMSIKILVSLWKAHNEEIRLIESEQRQQAEKDPRMKVYLSIPGIGFQTARVLSTELGDMSQFPNERKLFSFAGLTPCEYSSGEHERKGHISRQGSSRLRRMLVESAWAAVRDTVEWRRIFEKLAARTGKKKAIVAVGRRLLGRARALFRTNELYRAPRLVKRAA